MFLPEKHLFLRESFVPLEGTFLFEGKEHFYYWGYTPVSILAAKIIAQKQKRK